MHISINKLKLELTVQLVPYSQNFFKEINQTPSNRNDELVSKYSEQSWCRQLPCQTSFVYFHTFPLHKSCSILGHPPSISLLFLGSFTFSLFSLSLTLHLIIFPYFNNNRQKIIWKFIKPVHIRMIILNASNDKSYFCGEVNEKALPNSFTCLYYPCCVIY